MDLTGQNPASDTKNGEVEMMKKWVQLIARVTLQVLVLPNPGPGQTTPGYHPPDGSVMEGMLNRQLGTQAENEQAARFAIGIRCLPASSPESQLSIVYDLRGHAKITRTTLSRPLVMTVNEFMAKNNRQPSLGEIAGLIQTSTDSATVKAETAREWLAGLWQAISKMASEAPKEALKLDGTGRVSISLDETVYEIRYSDPEKQFHLTIPGPEPSRSGQIRELSPVVKWIVDLYSKFELKVKESKKK
jgi:hypothetical protein